MNNQSAEQILEAKLKFYEEQLAITANPEQKFELAKLVEDTRNRLNQIRSQPPRPTTDDGEATSVRVDRRDPHLLKRYFEIGAKHDSIFERLVELDDEVVCNHMICHGLAEQGADGHTYLTQAGVLLCCNREHLPQTQFHVHVEFRDKTGTEERSKGVWGCALFLYFQLYEQLAPLFERRLGSPSVRGEYGSESVIFEYPKVAIVEALVNFLIHRDYSVHQAGAITVHPDRIEFTNPGKSDIEPERLMAAQEPVQPKYSRNRYLIFAMNKARFNQLEGGGIIRIKRALGDNGTCGPDGGAGLRIENDDENNLFTLTIYRRTFSPSFKPVAHAHVPPRGPCYGRKELVERLAQSVVGNSPAPIPILGGPAIGKTTLVIAALYDSRVTGRFGPRRSFVGCSGARTRAELVAKIAQSLDVAQSPYPEDAVLAALGGGPAMLVLDDVDALLDSDRAGGQELLSRLAAVNGLALVTVFRGAQKPLHLEWGQAVHVLPLVPGDAREAFLSVAGREHANDPFLAPLLEATGYVPYGVMLLGSLAQTEPDLHALWARWRNERMKLLQGEDVSEELGRIAASFEVSIWAPRMDDTARRLLSILAMLPDGISPQEITEVFPHIGEAACNTLRRLALVFPKEPRLRLHALLREYIREKYPPHADDRRRAVEYYARLAVEEESRFATRASDQAVSRFAANLGNIETLIGIALRGEQQLVALEAAAALAGYVFLTGAGSRELVESALELQASMTPHARARLLKNCAELEMRYGKRDRAYQMYEASHDFFKAVADMGGAADCVKKIGDLEREAGKLTEAMTAYESALCVQHELNNVVGQAGCVASLADIAMAQERYLDARGHFEEAFQLYAPAENRAGMAYCKMRLGYLSFAQKDFEEARIDFEEAINLAGKAHDLLVDASALQGLGMAELECDRPDRAEDCFQQALPFFRRVDDTFGIGGCLRGLGDAARRRLDHGRAWQHYLDALVIYRRGPHWRDVGEIYSRLASVATSEDERRLYDAQAKEACTRASSGARTEP